jgi:hypothetical protein
MIFFTLDVYMARWELFFDAGNLYDNASLNIGMVEPMFLLRTIAEICASCIIPAITFNYTFKRNIFEDKI